MYILHVHKTGSETERKRVPITIEILPFQNLKLVK